MKTEEIILSKLYNAYFHDRSSVNLNSIQEELGLEETPFENVVDSMEHRNLIRVWSNGGFYEITAYGILNAEENNIASDDLQKENQHIRTIVLDYLATVYDKSGSFADAHIETLSHDLAVDVMKVVNNLQVLEDLSYVETVAMGSYKISFSGLEAVGNWRQRRGLVDEFEEITKLNPQPRGRALQKLLAKVIENNGWLQEEGAKTPNEEMDIIIHKQREYYLTECKWEKEHIEADVVRELYGKLGNRVGVQGIIISMSGFTSGAVKQAKDYANDRVIIFFGPDDINSLLYGKVSFDDLLNDKYQQLITRRKISFS